MAVAPDPRGQHFVTCQLCEDNVQFYCRPCKIRLCVRCVSPHLKTNAPDHNIVYYHKRFETTKSLHDPQEMRIIPCGSHVMLSIRYAIDSQFCVYSHVSFGLKRFRTNGTLVSSLILERHALYMSPYEDGVLYTGTDLGGIRKVNSEEDKLFLPIEGHLKGITIVQPKTIFVCNSSKVEKYTTSGEKLLEIEYNDQGEQIYRNPENISINGNGDICVADNYNNVVNGPVVVVVDQFGKYRFSYPPNPSSSPMDLCCDSCFHIIIASVKLHVIDKNGHFLRFLEYNGITKPSSLTIDDKDNLFVSEMCENYIRILKYLY